jgi:NAD(P)-dependent dehydrogenase (short-subunit alcohol dehydrogenase family)
MLLEEKNAIVYGAGGGIGSGVARKFAQEGARVFLAGRTLSKLERVAAEIAAAGGEAEAAELDVLDERAVEEHARAVAAEAGSIDISFNLISRGDVQGIPLVEMETADLLRPVMTGLQASFHTARAAAHRMVEQGSGVILYLTSGSSTPGASRGSSSGFHMGGTGPADAPPEVFMRYLASEVGASGVRVVGIWTAGVPETFARESDDGNETRRSSGMGPAEIEAMIAPMTMLHRAPHLAQIADTAAFLASDEAAAITGTIVNVSCGLVSA